MGEVTRCGRCFKGFLTGWFSLNRGSSCEGEAKALYNEIKQKVTSDWNFENREKYKDEVGLKKAEDRSCQSYRCSIW